MAGKGQLWPEAPSRRGWTGIGNVAGMPCLVALFALISPRLALFVIWLFTNLLSRAFESWVVPLLGFFLLPWTTLTYAAFWDWGSGQHVTGFEWFFVVLAFLIDVGSYSQGRRARSARDST